MSNRVGGVNRGNWSGLDCRDLFHWCSSSRRQLGLDTPLTVSGPGQAQSRWAGTRTLQQKLQPITRREDVPVRPVAFLPQH